MRMRSEVKYLRISVLADKIYRLLCRLAALILLPVSISLCLTETGFAYGISVTILSESGKHESYYGTECKTVTVNEGTSSASAAPFILQSQSTDIYPGNAFSSFSELEIIIQDRQKFLDIIPAGQSYLDLLLNINVTAEATTPLVLLPFGENAVSMVNASLSIIGGGCYRYYAAKPFA